MIRKHVVYLTHSIETNSATRMNGDRQRLLCVILPALNEEATIADVIEQIPGTMPGISHIDVLVVDDGSSDNTADVARQAGATVIEHRANLGLGVAIASGIDAALSRGADILVHLDSDGQFDAADIPKLVRVIDEEGFGLVTCTRYAAPELIPQMPWIKKIGGQLISRLVNHVIAGARFTDVSCGFRAYSREAAMKLTLFSSFTYTQESLIDMASKGIRIAEIPLRVRGVREFGASRVASNVWSYGFRTFTIILRAFRDKRPLTFFGISAVVFLLIGVTLGCAAILCLVFAPQLQIAAYTLLAGCALQLQLGAIALIAALVADQVARLRTIQEQTLYLTRRGFYEKSPDSARNGYPDVEVAELAPLRAVVGSEVNGINTLK